MTRTGKFSAKYAFVAVTVVHLGINVVGYAVGARTAPI